LINNYLANYETDTTLKTTENKLGIVQKNKDRKV